jgi:hypothetical protein
MWTSGNLDSGLRRLWIWELGESSKREFLLILLCKKWGSQLGKSLSIPSPQKWNKERVSRVLHP